jgi:membrane protein implicated in regulation of membrane protease activity
VTDPTPTDPTPRDPTRRDRTRPAELIGLSAIIAVAIGVITFFGTRTFLLAAEFAGVAFIVSLVVFAMLLVAISPRRGGDDDGPSGH